MAQDKKSFVAYCDWEETFEELSDDEAGRLVKHLFRYVNDKEPQAPDKITNMCFIPIRQTLKRDLKKYEDYKKKQSINGAKGGRPKKAKETQRTQPFSEKAKKADSVSDSVSDSDIPSINELEKSDSEIMRYNTEIDFVKDWNKARTQFEGKPTNIAKLSAHELQDFNSLKMEFGIEQFKEGMRGLFLQKNMFPANRLRPSHFLKDRNIEKYIDCQVNKTQLFIDNTKNDKL